MRIPAILLASTALLAASCTNTEQFRVNGTVDDNATMNIRVSYYANGANRTIVTAAREGKFEFFGTAPQPTVVEISDYEYKPLARLYAVNGETFNVAIDRKKPFGAEVEGNELSQRWASWLRESADKLTAGRDSANATVGRYIAAHPDDMLSTLLLLTAYDSSSDPLAADSLLALIAPQARPSTLTESYTYLLQRLVSEEATAEIAPFRFLGADSAVTFNPTSRKASLLAFTNEDDREYESVSERLEKAAKKARKGMRVYDLRTNPSTSFDGTDTLARTVGRMPGGIVARGIDKLGIPSLPYYIVTDSAGAQIYRGTALPRAIAVADSLSSLK